MKKSFDKLCPLCGYEGYSLGNYEPLKDHGRWRCSKCGNLFYPYGRM
jgi:transposase